MFVDVDPQWRKGAIGLPTPLAQKGTIETAVQCQVDHIPQFDKVIGLVSSFIAMIQHTHAYYDWYRIKYVLHILYSYLKLEEFIQIYKEKCTYQV